MISYSVLICTYNGQEHISEQLLSILNQKYKPDKIIISDDSNDDLTKNECINFFHEFKYENYIFLEGPKQGAKTNFLLNISENKSDFLFLSDQDDVWVNDKISIFEDYLKYTQVPTLWFSDSKVIDHSGNVISDSFFSFQGLSEKVFDDDSILFKNTVQGATTCLNYALCSLVKQSLDYVDINNIAMHDWWMALLVKYFGEHIYIDNTLIMYRQHDNNVIGAQKKSNGFYKFLINPIVYFHRLNNVVRQRDEILKLFDSKFVTSNVFNKPYKFSYCHVGLIKRLAIILFRI